MVRQTLLRTLLIFSILVSVALTKDFAPGDTCPSGEINTEHPHIGGEFWAVRVNSLSEGGYKVYTIYRITPGLYNVDSLRVFNAKTNELLEQTDSTSVDLILPMEKKSDGKYYSIPIRVDFSLQDYDLPGKPFVCENEENLPAIVYDPGESTTSMLTQSSAQITAQPSTVSASKTEGIPSSSMPWWATQTGNSKMGDGQTCPNGLLNYGHPLRPSEIEPVSWYSQFDGEKDTYYVRYRVRIKDDPKMGIEQLRVYDEYGNLLRDNSAGGTNTDVTVPVTPKGGKIVAPRVHVLFTYNYHYSISYKPNECEMSGDSEPMSWDIDPSS